MNRSPEYEYEHESVAVAEGPAGAADAQSTSSPVGGPGAPGRIRLFGIPIDNLAMSGAVRAMLDRLDDDGPHQVCFVNADCANIACRNRPYLDVLRGASLVLADGMGMKLAGWALGNKIRENVNGTDLFPRLCAALSGSGKRIFLLGAKPGVAEAVCDWIGRDYPDLVVAGCRHGYFSPEEEPAVIRHIAASRADLLLVAFGAPRQDLWIHRQLPELRVKVAVGVGGLFDFYSGQIPRAPLWIRTLGMEWLYRLSREPGRLWKRYLLGNAVFLGRLAAERLRRVGRPGGSAR